MAGESQTGNSKKKAGKVPPMSAEDVSPQVIRQFRTSLTARRFPALRNLGDMDVAQLVVNSPRAKLPFPLLETHVRVRDNTTAQSRAALSSSGDVGGESSGRSGVEGGSASASEGIKKVPFSPCNPSLAKHAITRKGNIFVGSSSPYDADKAEFLDRKGFDESKRLGPSPFAPNSASQAKTMISVNYYLNSPDTHQLQTERHNITQRIEKNSKMFKHWYDTKRRTI